MSNMSYCRFQNTLDDLRDCYVHIEELQRNDSSDITEVNAMKKLIELCKTIAEEY